MIQPSNNATPGPIQNTPPAAWKAVSIFNNSSALLSVRTTKITDWLGPYESGVFPVDSVTADITLTPSALIPGVLVTPLVWGTFYTTTETIPDSFPGTLNPAASNQNIPQLPTAMTVLYQASSTTTTITAGTTTNLFATPIQFGVPLPLPPSFNGQLRSLYVSGYDISFSIPATFPVNYLISKFSISGGGVVLQINHPGVVAGGAGFAEKVWPIPVKLGVADGNTIDIVWQVTANALGTSGTETMTWSVNVYGFLQ